jgi:hypothetical protein
MWNNSDICSVCWNNQFIITAWSSGWWFFFEKDWSGEQQYCDKCFDIMHWWDGKYAMKNSNYRWGRNCED